MGSGAKSGGLAPPTAKSLIEALDLRALRARRGVVDAAAALQDAEATAQEAARQVAQVIEAAALARREAETALGRDGGARMSDILAIEHQEIAARRARETAELASHQAAQALAAAKRKAAETVEIARAAEKRVEKVRFALEREIGAAERIAALRQEEAAADGDL